MDDEGTVDLVCSYSPMVIGSQALQLNLPPYEMIEACFVSGPGNVAHIDELDC